jgi:hypothetical protein
MVDLTAEFVFNRWDLGDTSVLPYLGHIMSRAFDWKLSSIFYVGLGCGSPELYSLGPDWFEYSFVDEEFFVYTYLCLNASYCYHGYSSSALSAKETSIHGHDCNRDVISTFT